ncbi:septum formation initiator family protein [Prevotella sp. S7-1-8]|uniref:FtsB family cell division protein n=1 Tax=Prevotella sp. S7-1-8 TaxID=1284775 RepID=UPI00056820F0|nr:septum formation initiator family protein [Prevotella sp. S7-1-8]
MSGKLTNLWNMLSQYKYVITFVVGVALVGFIDDNSFLRRVQYDMQIGKMRDEIRKYNLQNEKATQALDELRRNPKAIRKIARERYFMKADDEDIYVLSTDQQAADEAIEKANNIDETAQ